MSLIMNDDVIDKMEEIYKSQSKPRYYKWLIDLDYQFKWLEERLDKHDADLEVVDVEQDKDNFNLVCVGDKDIIACIDMSLLVYSRNNKFKYMLTLKNGGDNDL